VSGDSETPREITRDTDADPPGAPRGADFEPGAIVGEYQVVRLLGRGGMGSVYEAVHTVIEKRVAIKVMRSELSRDEEAVARFTREAKAVNRIRHPSIVDVFGFGRTEDGRCFLVMELLEGESLGRRLHNDDAPTVAEACDILISMTHALDAAHATEIIHRDLKPDNVFLVEGKHVKLLDFGIAKLLTADNPVTEYTQPGQAMGTPRYISPEQARGQLVDARTDIYSLGVMAFELLTGKLPFTGRNAMELIAQHVAETPPTPTDLAPTLPPAADTLLLQMLDKEPAKRPPLGVIRAMLDDIRAPWVTTITPPSARPKPSISELITVAKPRAEVEVPPPNAPEAPAPARNVKAVAKAVHAQPAPAAGVERAKPVLEVGRTAKPSGAVDPRAPVPSRSQMRWQVPFAIVAAILAGVVTFLLIRSM
jgi:serine/threonine-protein kinase